MAEQKSQRGVAKVFFVIFLILFIVLLILVIWFFFFRSTIQPFERVCTADKNCLPNEYCNNSICNAVQCSKSSDCSKTANGSGQCINGYCQLPVCSGNAECSAVKGSDYACVSYTPSIITEWINTACVKTGTPCTANTDCYGGNFGLVCSAGICSQCGDSKDCANGYICGSNGLCTTCNYAACSGDTPCTSNCGSGNVCTGTGTCCASGTYYNVNNTTSCIKGKTFDICQADTDCESGKCYDIGTTTGGVHSGIKVCGFSATDECLFTAGTKATSAVTGLDPTLFKNLTCGAPNNVYDVAASPFCAAGKCQHLSEGSACYVPPYCASSSNQPNLLCSGNITFTNPYQQVCQADADCSSNPSNTLCSNGICSQPCSKNGDCITGFMCTKGACVYPSSTVSCTTNNANCPSGYECQGAASGNKSGTCQFSTTDNSTPPPPPVFLNICSIAASTVNASDINTAVSSYCVSGFCQNYSGWVGQTCQGNEDCALVSSNANGRTSLMCISKKVTSSSQAVNICLTPGAS